MSVPQSIWKVLRPLRHAASGVSVREKSDDLVTEGGWEIAVSVFRPAHAAGRLPALLLVPGLGQTKRTFDGWSQALNAREVAALGIVVMTVDLSGRGRSWGTEVFGGPEHHGDVRTCLRALAANPNVDPGRIGIVSFSLGSNATAGALASDDRPAVSFWIDWEGPSDREIITSGGKRMAPAAGHGLTDDRYWYPREASRLVGKTHVPYLRYQSAVDHAQPGEFRHARRMIDAAAAGELPWFQLNDHPRNTVPSEPVWRPAGLQPARRWLHEQIRTLLCLA